MATRVLTREFVRLRDEKKRSRTSAVRSSFVSDQKGLLTGEGDDAISPSPKASLTSSLPPLWVSIQSFFFFLVVSLLPFLIFFLPRPGGPC